MPQADESHATADLFEEDGSIDLWNLSTIVTDPSPMTSADTEVGHGARDDVPLPTSWQTQEEGSVGAPLRGAGLGLLKLRALPLLGRRTSRDHLWTRALEVEAARGLRGVSLVGFAGAGKSALARWLTTRAHELAGWTHVWVSCDASRSCEEVLLAGLDALLGTGALSTRTDVHRRLTRRLDLDSGVLHALTEALRPSTPNSGAIDVALLAHVLAGIGATSPLLLVLDDAHAIHDGLGAFVRALRHACEGVGARVLVLVTASLEQEQSDERVRALIDELGFERHDVGPLDPASHARLVGSVLDLSAGERARLLELTRGNPLHSLHVLEHWIGRSNLVATDSGFAHRDGTAFTWPEHLDDVCAQRAHNAVSGSNDAESAWLSLHSAALLGQELTWSEWEGVCAGRDPGALLGSMVRAGLAERTRGGWRFTFGLMRAHLETSCRARGQWNDAHGACASALVDDGPRSAQTWRRVAHHRFASAQWAAGLDALEHGFYDLTLSSCEAALTEIEAKLPEAPDPMLDARVELVRCHVALMRGELEQTGARLSRIGARIEEHGWDDLRGRWASLSIELALFTGEVDGGITLARAYMERLGGDTDGTWQRMTCLRQLAELHQSVHHLDEAADALEEAMRLADGRHPWQAAWIAHNLASIDQERGRYTHAHAWLEHAEPVFEELGDLIGSACCASLRGFFALFEGDLDVALERFTHACTLFDLIGDVGAVMTLESIARVHVLRGDDSKARQTITEIMSRGGEGTFVEDVALWLELGDTPDADVTRSLDSIAQAPPALWCHLEVAWVLCAGAKRLQNHARTEDTRRTLELATRVRDVVTWAPETLDATLAAFQEAW